MLTLKCPVSLMWTDWTNNHFVMPTGIKRVLYFQWVSCDCIMPAGLCMYKYRFMPDCSVFWTDTSLSGLQDGGTATNSVQYKRLQVLNMWSEIQQVEQEIKEKLVSTVTITATERRIKDLKVLGDKLSAYTHIFCPVHHKFMKLDFYITLSINFAFALFQKQN